MLKQPLTFRAGELEPALLARADNEDQRVVSEIARRDLTRYYQLLRMTLPTFAEGEASLLCDVLNGTRLDEHTMTLLWAEISDALADGLAEKWEVDGPALVARLRALTPAEAYAVVDACERFWRGPYRQDGPMIDQLRAVGLVAR